ncbi:hypothetical protein GCM10007860_33650 [Chitiniphilus shinanonensis]|uniref:TonB C-terminal domain-containing protein n=1 Tax=Chitiniphilus shinanonensis TaxID=553088 RepID=A0ABQ6BW39_9NEIS|nr:hypothetical protein [Chitiniphilus shinanonensis]GLS06195.1 hypothetical protein GCM10007860_33650 [Chitiniphilus shinanonensis]
MTALREVNGLGGVLGIVVRDLDGRIVEERRVKNLITTAGRVALAQLMTGGASPGRLQIAVGGSGKETAPEQTALLDPLDIADATVPALGAAPPEDEAPPRVKATVQATLPARGSAGEVQALQEAGIVITLSNQQTVLYNRVTFPPINRSGNLELTLTWEVIF